MEDKKEKTEQKISSETIPWTESIKNKVFVIFGVLVFLALIGIHVKARAIGNDIGNTAGKTAGVAVGSYEGVTRGLKEGYEAGKEQGLSAEDINVDITNKLSSIGKLEVLVAEDKINDVFKKGSDYAALLEFNKTKATFSVDLTQAEIADQNSAITINIPVPEVEIAIDENESVKIAEWQKYFWSGDAESGYIAYMNSMAQIKEKSENGLTNYDYLMQQAKDTAKKQIELLVKSICGREKEIQVIFKGEE